MNTHKGLEELIKDMARARKEMEESPGPTVLRADKMCLELAKESLEWVLDACQRGRPTLDGPGGLSRLFESMGFVPTVYAVATEWAQIRFGEFKAICERMGFPADKCCEKIVAQLAMREIGGLPKPDVMFASSHGCDADHKYYPSSCGELFNIPVFFVDYPLSEDDKPNLASLNYVADQLGEFIEWAEKKFPGVKYDEDRHIEMQEVDAIGQRYVREIYQLAKHVPCPVVPMDALAGIFIYLMPSRYPNPQKAVEYLRTFRDELGERVISGQGPYPEERLRLMWAGKAHALLTTDPSKLLLERKVALPLSLQGDTIRSIGLRGTPIGEMSEYGVVLSPIQEEADLLSVSCWGGPGKRWVNATLQAARDIGAHGIIHFQQIGCTPGRGMGSVVAERAEKELGIPTLNLEAKYQDKGYMSQEQFEEILSPFIDKCFDWAGKPRQ